MILFIGIASQTYKQKVGLQGTFSFSFFFVAAIIHSFLDTPIFYCKVHTVDVMIAEGYTLFNCTPCTNVYPGVILLVVVLTLTFVYYWPYKCAHQG